MLVIGPSRAAVGTRRRAGGFSLVELVVVMLISVVLMGILFPVISKARRAAQAAHCLSNLRQIAVGFHVYAGDNGGRLPDPNAADESWEAAMARYLRAQEIYRCPADSEVFPAVGCSYDWRDTGDPETTLAGRPLSDATARNCVLAFDALPHWHLKGWMNVARTDTSVCAMEIQVGLEDLMTPVKKDKQKKSKGKGKGKGNNG